MKIFEEHRLLRRMAWARNAIHSLSVGNSLSRSPHPTPPLSAAQQLQKQLISEIQTILKDLGPRISRWGLPATVAFLMHRAGFWKHEDASTRHQAHRWVLDVLFERDPGEKEEVYFDLVSGRRVLDRYEIDSLVQNILWLRRYSQLLAND